jgi:hypothetical protein
MESQVCLRIGNNVFTASLDQLGLREHLTWKFIIEGVVDLKNGPLGLVIVTVGVTKLGQSGGINLAKSKTPCGEFTLGFFGLGFPPWGVFAGVIKVTPAGVTLISG